MGISIRVAFGIVYRLVTPSILDAKAQTPSVRFVIDLLYIQLVGQQIEAMEFDPRVCRVYVYI